MLSWFLVLALRVLLQGHERVAAAPFSFVVQRALLPSEICRVCFVRQQLVFALAVVVVVVAALLPFLFRQLWIPSVVVEPPFAADHRAWRQPFAADPCDWRRMWLVVFLLAVPLSVRPRFGCRSCLAVHHKYQSGCPGHLVLYSTTACRCC